MSQKNLAEMLRMAVNANRGNKDAVSERDGKEYVWVKYDAGDYQRMMWLDEHLETRLREAISKNFVDHVTGFKPNFYDGRTTEYEPVFEEEIQKKWDIWFKPYK